MEVFAQGGEGGPVFAGEHGVGGEGAVPESVEADSTLTFRGSGAGGLQGVAAVGGDAGWGGHGVDGWRRMWHAACVKSEIAEQSQPEAVKSSSWLERAAFRETVSVRGNVDHLPWGV